MKTVLYSPCYVDGHDASGSSRLERMLRYLRFYRQMKEALGFDKIILSDNGSGLGPLFQLPAEIVTQDLEMIRPGKCDTLVVRYHQHVGKTGKVHYDYPFCWRALYFMRKLILDFNVDRIITIDSDGFILSNRLAEFVRSIDTGWQSFWCEKWQFPEAAFHVLCKDAFPRFLEFTADLDYMSKNGLLMEETLPFTHVNRQFRVDRFGENRIPQLPEFDFYAQAPVGLPLSFTGEIEI